MLRIADPAGGLALEVPPGTVDRLESDERFLEVYRNLARAAAHPDVEAMANDGAYYHETREPFQNTADYGTITLSTTSLMLFPYFAGDAHSSTGGYWKVGKRWNMKLMGKITTAATPGNLVIEIRYGTADNAGTILATTAATAMAASKTNITWELDVHVECRAFPGTAAGLFAWGKFQFDGAGGLFTTASNQPLYIPASAAAAVNVDLTQPNSINVQMKRSGSTAETVTVQDRAVHCLT